MGSATSFQVQPQRPAPSAATVGQMLLQRRMAEQPANAEAGAPAQLPGNTMQGIVPAVGRRLLQRSPTGLQTAAPMSAQFGGMS